MGGNMPGGMVPNGDMFNPNPFGGANPFANPNPFVGNSPFENPMMNSNSMPNPFEGGGEVDVDELLKKIDAKIAELEEEERLEKEKNAKIEDKKMDDVIEEFKSDLNSISSEDKELASELPIHNPFESEKINNKTFNDIINENSNSSVETLEMPLKENIDINKISNESNITDDQYFDDFFQDE